MTNPPKPYAHQASEFEATKELRDWALWWEQGTGKTRPTIDTAAHLFREGKIDALLVIAPKAVAPNWAFDELPKHMPSDVLERSTIVNYRSSRAMTQKFQRELEKALKAPGLLIVCMPYDSIMTEMKPGAKAVKNVARTFKGKEFAKEVLTIRRTMMVLDESARIKSPRAKRTKRLTRAGRLAAYRRVLTGTPIANSPFDSYTQIRFLDPDFWPKRGLGSPEAFRQNYGEWEKRLINPHKCMHPDGAKNPGCNCPKYPKLLDYKNLDDLHDVMKEVGSRLLKEDCLDLPDKIYHRRKFYLTPAQKSLYKVLATELRAMLKSGDSITTPLAITKLLRLQEITSGYCPTDGGHKVLVDNNPRPAVLCDVFDEFQGKKLVFAKFRHDFEQIRNVMIERDMKFVEYHGAISEKNREIARRAIQDDPDCEVFLGNPASCGEGLTLHAASTVVFYNTTFKLGERLQAEDRAHRIGQLRNVDYVDIVAQGTVDEYIIDKLVYKKNLSDMIMGDPKGEWIE